VGGFCLEDIKQHFLIQRNWRYLVGTSACYFMLGLSSSSLGINDSRVWKLENFTSSILHATNLSYLPQPDLSIIEVLHRGTTISMIAILLGPLLGSIVFIAAISFISREKIVHAFPHCFKISSDKISLDSCRDLPNPLPWHLLRHYCCIWHS